MDSSSIKTISKSFIKPKIIVEESKLPYYLSPWDYIMLSVHYIQKGLLFRKPLNYNQNPKQFMETLLQDLKDSLAITLVHFYPLSGRFSTPESDKPEPYSVFVDCENSPGAGFIYATTDLCVEDIAGAKYVPLVVQPLFDHHKAVNHDGHILPLLTVKVTEFVDGVFIGLSMNHAMGDGSSFWQFFNSYSQIFNNKNTSLKNPPILNRYMPQGYGPLFTLPFTNPQQFIKPYESPLLKERIFKFSSQTIKYLKSKANQESKTTSIISSYQSLTALIWISITKARNLPKQQETSCRVAANNRTRMEPKLDENYFGNCISAIRTAAKAGELLENGLGWAALKVNEVISEHKSDKIRGMIDKWLESPMVYHIDELFEPLSVMMGSSPRFDKYGCEFGMGKAMLLRSGYAHKFDGKVSAYPGREGSGSIDLEVCLVPEFMEALEEDQEFMSLVSFSD